MLHTTDFTFIPAEGCGRYKAVCFAVPGETRRRFGVMDTRTRGITPVRGRKRAVTKARELTAANPG